MNAIRTLLVSLCLCGSAYAVDGRIVANVDELPASPTRYTILCLPSNYKTDPLSQDIIKGFQSNEALKALRTSTTFWPYDEDNADYKFRWADRISELPCVIVMDGDKVIYKRSKAGTEQLAKEIGEQKVCGWPRICPGPNCPNCPDQPDDEPSPRTPKRPTPSTPKRPLIPDTPPLPIQPVTPPPAVDDTRLKDLTARVDQLESQIKVLKLAEGKPGADGKPGPQGKQGEQGPAGEVDYAKIHTWMLEHKSEFKGTDGVSPTLNLDDLAKQVAAKLPPITFVEKDHNGVVLNSVPVQLGGKAVFSPFTVNYLDGTGKIIDTEYVQPFGGTLQLHIDVLKQ